MGVCSQAQLEVNCLSNGYMNWNTKLRFGCNTWDHEIMFILKGIASPSINLYMKFLFGLGSDRWRNRKPRNKKKKRRKKKRIAARRSVFCRVHWIYSVQAFAVLTKLFARSHRLQDPARNVRVISVEMEEEGNSTSQTVSERCFKKISYIHPLVSGQLLTLPSALQQTPSFRSISWKLLIL